MLSIHRPLKISLEVLDHLQKDHFRYYKFELIRAHLRKKPRKAARPKPVIGNKRVAIENGDHYRQRR